MSFFKESREQRKYPRFEIPVKLRPTECFGKKGRVQNICIGGVRIFASQKVEIGKTITIDFALPTRDWVTADVVVVWVKERRSDPKLKYDIGCRFTDIFPEYRTILVEYLVSITPKKD